MIELHFIEESENLPEGWEQMESVKEYATKYADFLIQDEQERIKFEAEHTSFELYIRNRFPITDCIYIQKKSKNNNIRTVKMNCLEYLIGEKIYSDWKWNTPEVQKAYSESKNAGADWWKQFATNPDGAVDYMDSLTDRNRYSEELKKIEKGMKEGKYENR